MMQFLLRRSQSLISPHPLVRRWATRSATRLSSSTLDNQDWRNHPSIRKTIEFPTFVVPSANCQEVLRAPVLKDYLGHVDHVHPRIRLVRSLSSSTHDDTKKKTHQLILRNPDMTAELSLEALELLQSLDVQLDGPTYPVELQHDRWTVPYILQQLLPEEAHPPPTAYEQIGHVAHLNLKPLHEPYAQLIGQVLVESIATIETVVNKVGEVSGDFRTYDMQVLAGKQDTNVMLSESGVKLKFDLQHVYWSSRLSGERAYMMKNVFQEGQTICDPFCGVGAQVLQAAQKLNCTIIANDWNPEAVKALKKNVQRNHVEKRFVKVSCQDAYDFLTDVGLTADRLPDHVVMNFPLESPKFLSALRWWPGPRKKDETCTFHLYMFARGDENRSPEQVAIDVVAENLLPLGGAAEEKTGRQAELDALGCQTQTRVIRDVAPGKVVICVSFQVTKRLVKHIQGDFM